MNDPQDTASRIGALGFAVKALAKAFAVAHGKGARREIETIRDQVVHEPLYSEVPPERAVEQTQVIRPGIQAVEAAFSLALLELPDD